MVGQLRVLAFAIVVGLGASAFGATVSENFDNNTDGYWEHLNNETAPQNYGWRAADGTINASGSNALGGSFARDFEPSNFYGFNIGDHDLRTEALHAEGTLYVQNRDGGSGWNFGFFSGASSYNGQNAGDARNALIFGLSDGEDAQLYIYSPSGGRDRSGFETENLSGAVPFTFDWAPGAGGNEKGVLTGTINGVTHTVGFGGDHTGEPITHFGVFSVSADGGSSIGYLDNLTFTSKNPIPEPASLSLLAMGALATLRRRRA
jgi:hypothetical protein